MARPGSLPVWNTNQTNIAITPITNQDDGWLNPGGIPQKPPFEVFNYWQNLVYLWIRHQSDTLYVDDAGQVAIGNTSPQALLHIDGDDILVENTYGLTGKNSGGTEKRISYIDGSNNYKFADNHFSIDPVGKASLPNDPGALMPSGAILAWPTSTPPSGYLTCDGSGKDTTTYAALFAVLGYAYGGSGSTFNLPDYRGEFLRGWDNGAGNDPDASGRTTRGDGTAGDNVGTKQSDAFQGWQMGVTISGTTYYGYSDFQNFNVDASVSAGFAATRMNTANQGDDSLITAKNDGTNGDPRTTTETRPTNVYVQYIIKY